MEKIVVIGGGFAGIIIAKELAHSKDSRNPVATW